jgi:antitoxin (DNA-binding transcriptional repressor) of toxin-antitoxin stability system
MIQQQTKILPASEVKNNFGAIASQVKKGEYKAVIVENHGEPIVAIVAVTELEAMREYREKERQKDALKRLRTLRSRIQARIKGKITDKEADEIANRLSRELIEDLEKTGKIEFDKNAS